MTCDYTHIYMVPLRNCVPPKTPHPKAPPNLVPVMNKVYSGIYVLCMKLRAPTKICCLMAQPHGSRMGWGMGVRHILASITHWISLCLLIMLVSAERLCIACIQRRHILMTRTSSIHKRCGAYLGEFEYGLWCEWSYMKLYCAAESAHTETTSFGRCGTTN